MMVMTAKVDFRKIIMVLAGIAGIVLALILLLRGGNNEAPATATVATGSITNNDSRVQFLKDFGWDVTTSPTESSQVRIPEESTEVFDRYNALQKSQGYDLSAYSGKAVMRYVYQVNNFPGATEPVYATLLVYKNQVIGGDITNTAPGGVVQGFQKSTTQDTEETAPTTPTPPETSTTQ